MAEAEPDGILAAYVQWGGHIDPDTLDIIVQPRLVAPGGLCAPAVTGVYDLYNPVPEPVEALLDDAALLLRALIQTDPADEERLQVLHLMADEQRRRLTERARRIRIREAEALIPEPPGPGRWERYAARATAALARSIEHRAYAIHCAALRRAGDPEPDY